jgi:hypothetical protein
MGEASNAYPSLEPVLTTSELAAHLRVPVQTIHAQRGQRGFRVGSEMRYRLSEVLHWVEAMGPQDHAADFAEAAHTMSGRDRLQIGTHGDINTTRTAKGAVRAEARYRDGDGTVRKVTTTAATVKEAKQNLRRDSNGGTPPPDSATCSPRRGWYPNSPQRC